MIGQHQRYLQATFRGTLDGELLVISVELTESTPNVGQADTLHGEGLFEVIQARSVVLHPELQTITAPLGTNRDVAPPRTPCDAVLEGVFHERLEDKKWHLAA